MPITGKATYDVAHRTGNRWAAYEGCEGVDNSDTLVGILIDVNGDRSAWTIEGDPRQKIYTTAMAACRAAAEHKWIQILGPISERR